MSEQWREIEGFPGYSVSNEGRVRNDAFDRIMALSRNQQRVVSVGLVRDRVQHKRSVTLLVAHAFVPKPNELFDTPIHLDGDRDNIHASNLMWRPRWFAVKYHMQFDRDDGPSIVAPIEEINTHQRFANSREAVTTYGLLERELVLATLNNTYVFPTFQMFRIVDDG